MSLLRAFLLAALAFAWCAEANAVEFDFQGYADFRLVVPGGERSWLDGGLGKLRFGANQPDPNFRFVEAVGQGSVSLTDDLRLLVVARVEPEQRTGVDLLEAYAVYHPHIEGWSLSLKAGAFFPPFSLENTDLGWTSPYSLTPSAINSWIGDELRTVGGELRGEHQTALGVFAVTGSLFCCNDPAGVLMADRGWTLDDRPTGMIEEVREPDATLKLFSETPPERTTVFVEIDHRVGWYLGASWSKAGIGKLAFYRYDNNGDPATVKDDYATWRTRFWSLGWESHFDALSILAQGLVGDTAIEPFAGFVATTHFKSAFLLAAYDLDEVRLAARAEAFQTRSLPGLTPLDEDGHAFTVAASWIPKDWLRLSAELIAIDSRRGERLLDGENPNRSDTQLQLSVRVLE